MAVLISVFSCKEETKTIETATVSKEDDVDAKLTKYLNESDYLANNSKTSYFRLNK